MAFLPFKSRAPQTSPDCRGRRALVVTTSHGTLDEIDATNGALIRRGKPTGVYASEFTEPYYVFRDAGVSVDVASISGGKIPIEPQSLTFPVRTAHDARFLRDPELKHKTEASLSIANLSFVDYDIIFMAGGWGAAYDLAQSDRLSSQLTAAFAAGRILGGVCHGSLGFIGATKPDGSALLDGVTVTGVTNRQLRFLGITHTPRHPETELRNAGACYESSRHPLTDLFANHVCVDAAHRIVSAQNQKGGVEAAEKALELLASIDNVASPPTATAYVA